jgi:alpha-ketoglutarate-dependent taurine dioxygenase
VKPGNEAARPESGIKPLSRRVIRISQETLVKTSFIGPGQRAPLLIEPNVSDLNLAIWAAESREFISVELSKYGALLLRNFRVESTTEFEKYIGATSGGPLPYLERSSPRSQVSGSIYTSTDHPPDQAIFLHNEQSYNSVFPTKIYFFCVTPAEIGGETPIADTRRILERIDPPIRESFIRRRYLYVRNFGHGFGLSWQDAFQTTDKRAVEGYCLKHGIDIKWKEKDRLMTRQVRRAVARHPRTGETVWFNHATFFHISTIDSEVRKKMLTAFGEDELPNNTYYGDGQPIEPEVIQHLRSAYLQEKILFRWQAGDILMLDNMLVSHGREAFRGQRSVLVGMADQMSWGDDASTG